MQTLIIHGRQPALGRAELESLYGSEKLRPAGDMASLLNLDPASINFNRMGGALKLAKVLTILDTTNWGKIQHFVKQALPVNLSSLPEGKLRLGLSSYGLNITSNRMQATGLELKKIIKTSGRSVRYVPNMETSLNSAQVLHNKLTGDLGRELIFVRDGDKTIVAQTMAVQDIENYASRDQKRPYRDARIGMLPPKLAQIIVNLSVGSNPPDYGTVILDPFCGTGVILQEASLMGYDIAGSDLDARMVEYSDANLIWLKGLNANLITHNSDGRYYRLHQADATDYQWQPMANFIASEIYLGRPFSNQPDLSSLEKVIKDCDTITTKFLKNVYRQTQPGFRLCLAVPAWKSKKGFIHLPTLEKLSHLGYNRLSFVHADNKDLIYHRPGQVVGRELVVLERM
jgi:tRNA G10  N-methylase Trm11